ncbi:hypothetical protein ACFVXH_39605 [Kitasatospora sp. NPDC058184]|uniref:hypothetical protein n=1 Tax=Kitasatospora sp. NPDC058184 TaxID=3346370 RepID=UPI0036DD2BF8
MNDAFATDPDLRHLARLLAMLPGRDDIAFWATVDNGASTIVEPGHTGPGTAGPEYILSKMRSGIAKLNKAEDPAAVAYFSHYLLMFFDGDQPALWKYLNDRFSAHGGRSTAGERYTRDLCDTAWRIIARYDTLGDNDLAELWPGHPR